MNFWMTLSLILAVILIGMFANEFYYWLVMKRRGEYLTEDAFREGMRKAQVIDVREKDAFDAGHILGARNIPYTVLKDSLGSIRKDKPVYLYDQRKAMAIRAVKKLNKAGYQELYVLKGGYENWTGKVKKKNNY